MKKLLLLLSVVLFANQASADVEYLCNAWSGTYSDEKPFILKKIVLSFFKSISSESNFKRTSPLKLNLETISPR